VNPVYLFDLAGRQAEWLSLRQQVIAGNVANANTPAFRAKDLKPFGEILDKTQLAMTATSPDHLTRSGLEAAAADLRSAQPWDVAPTGNSVNLEQEMIKAGEVNRDFALNTSIVKTFHRMLMSCVKV
jgi:flagellar basal-body rod protein FlgB